MRRLEEAEGSDNTSIWGSLQVSSRVPVDPPSCDLGPTLHTVDVRPVGGAGPPSRLGAVGSDPA